MICPNLADFPVKIGSSASGYLNGNEIICGGGYGNSSGSTACYNLMDGTHQKSLNRPREVAAAVTLENVFLVFGGVNDQNPDGLNSVEILSQDENSPVMINIPFKWYLGCAVKISRNAVMLLGGKQDGIEESKTWIFDFQNGVSQGPEMTRTRWILGCGKLSGLNSVAAFGGVAPATKSTEILSDLGFFKQSIF